MSLIVGSAVTGAGGAGSYSIDNSLRTRASASAYLSKTNFTGAPTTFTLSMWVKRGQLGTRQTLAAARAESAFSASYMEFLDTNQLQVNLANASNNSGNIVTTAVFRDPSAWYHIVLASTSAGTVYLYVNNVQVGSASVGAGYWLFTNTANFVNTLGRYGDYNGFYFDGYMADVNFIDGQALTPSSFGATNASTGVWQPKAYVGSYGTNGFYLKFSNIATTSGSNTGLGQDFSGNGRYWNTNNISVTAGATYDAMKDSPTPASSTVGNFATWNPLVNVSSRNTFSNANLTVSSPGNPNYQSVSTLGMSGGKWYCELSWDSGAANRGINFGITNNPMSTYNYFSGSSDANSWTYSSYDGTKNNNGSATSYGASYTLGDIIGIAFDADAGTLTFYKNNVSQGTAFTGLTSGPYFVMASNGSGAQDGWWGNFGQRPFAYTPPTGFKAMCTSNLPTPTIGASSTTLANKYFDAVTYTGNNSYPRTVTNTGGFYPDLVWVKARSIDYLHVVYDSVRGTGTTKALSTELTSAEGAYSSYTNLSAFTSSGFTIGTTSLTNIMNNSGTSFVAWEWNAGSGSSVTNTAGSITSTVSANTTSGFSVVTYTGTGANATVGHGLGVAPSVVICKNRSSTGGWLTGFTVLGWNKYVVLNTTEVANNAPTEWNGAPTSTVFTLGTDTFGNASGANFVAYCWAEVAGFSKFGSYTGNGSSDGTFVYTGFRPRYIMIKRSDSANNWFVLDTARDAFNLANDQLLPNSSAAESTNSDCNIDILSNGFKLRTALDASNANGGTYIYMAFAENPFNYSLAR